MDKEFDFQTFLNSLSGLGYRETREGAELKHGDMLPLSDMRSRRKSNGTEVRVLASRMRARMADLLWWLDHGIRPGSMPLDDFLRMEPICKALIAKGELKIGALDIFTQARAEVPR